MRIEHTTTATDLRDELRLLYAERVLANLDGLSADPLYMADLLDDIAAHEAAYVGAAVTEIAVLRAELDGPQQG
jgi:hypothetical protein